MLNVLFTIWLLNLTGLAIYFRKKAKESKKKKRVLITKHLSTGTPLYNVVWK